MTSAFLQSELASLIQDSKRKHNDVRTTAERSLTDLKSISVTSETQLAGDLLRKPQFIDPFVLACRSKLSKLAITGAVCLQRLVASRAVPRGRLADVLDAFHEASNQGLDVQLKILQALPSLLQLYASELHGEPLASVLSLCAGLAASRTNIVSSTAAATFQQLITSVFERITRSHAVAADDPDARIAVDDATKVFNDMCMVVKSEPPQFLKMQGISVALALDVIENCLSNEDLPILQLAECATACKDYLVPGAAVALEDSNNFCIFAQCLRITYLLLSSQMPDFSDEMADVLHAVMDWLDRGVAASWKRILCLEFMKDICSDFDVLRWVYTIFDRRAGQRRVVQDLMSILVRIAAEDPSLIGLGRQSTIPTNSAADDNAVFSGSIDVQDLGAIGSVTQASQNVTGISTKWSTINTPVLEQLDRKTAPEIPETYVYTVVLACVAAFSDGLSKFIMPLSVPIRSASKVIDTEEGDENIEIQERKGSQRSQKYQRLMNPLKREDLSNTEDVKMSAAMIEDCWPAVLATCSTFLNSALDSTFYHILVRTVQKLAQVSGVMELLTPRDALLTSLAKVSVPINASSIIVALHGGKQAKRDTQETEQGDDSESIKSPVQAAPRSSIDASRQSLNVRNLLCLRALLNLGIALGPTLSEASWFIIIQALQQVEALMSVSPGAKSTPNTPNPQSGDGEHQTNLASEITAVGTASKRMIESTKTYTDLALEVFTRSIFKMIDDLTPASTNGLATKGEAQEKRPTLTPRLHTHRSTRSVSGMLASSAVLHVEAEFVLKTISGLARVNLHRFAIPDSQAVSWDLIVSRLLLIVSTKDVEPSLRLHAASIADLIAMEVVKLLEKSRIDPEDLDALHQASLRALSRQLDLLYRGYNLQQDSLTAEIEIHRRLLDALENIVSHSGESLKHGWSIVFQILQSTVRQDSSQLEGIDETSRHQFNEDISVRTIAPAFRTVQLIVSDFLSSIDSESLWVLVQLLPLFGLQKHDVNISLTTATLFWNVNALILDRTDTINVSENLMSVRSPIEDADSVIATETSTLWFATMMHLAELCSGMRPDVRNGSIRVLMRIFDASSGQLTPAMWNLSIQKVLLSTLASYAAKSSDVAEWHVSFSHLLSGLNSLLEHHSEAIIRAQEFLVTWADIIQVFRAMLAQRSVGGHIAVFTSAGELVKALSSARSESVPLLQQLLRLWVEFHPADLEHHEDSSAAEFEVHAQLLTRIDSCNPHALEDFTTNGDSLPKLIMESTRRTTLEAVHGRYADDVKRLSTEQEAAIENISLLQRTRPEYKNQYSQFLLGLIESALNIHEQSANSEMKIAKGLRKPKLIAFMTKCMELLKQKIPDSTVGNEWLENIAASATLGVLARVIRTKYGGIPVNESLPAWQIATVIAVNIVQAASEHTNPLTATHVKLISSATLPLAEAILNAPELDNKSPQPPIGIIKTDERFDVEHAQKLHRAAQPILQRPECSAEVCKQYALMVFRASLIARPGSGDFPPDVANDPLQNIEYIRAGSVRSPDFCIRQSISFEAFDNLLDLVTKPSADASSSSAYLAENAAPYVLLRLAHTIKAFLADQRLRYLTPPPRPIQKELNLVLSKALRLRCLDEAFHALYDRIGGRDQVRQSDGKTHLRLLLGLVLNLKDFWTTLPRLKVCAWQEDEDGSGIEQSLQEWNLVLASGGLSLQSEAEARKTRQTR